jgi:hypothetical protein
MRTHVRRALAMPAAVAILVGAAATATGLTSVQHVSATTCTTLGPSPVIFHFTGTEQCFVVPANVTSIHAVLLGGIGGTGYANAAGSTAGTAGHGAQVTADVAVTPGESIYVEVAGNGNAGSRTVDVRKPAVVAGNGGFNGGASGGGPGFNFNAQAAGGGGGTDLRTVAGTLTACDSGTNYEGGASSLASRLLVAGGGGGGGNPANLSSSTAGNGGTGGAAPTGGGTPLGGGTGGGPGTQSAGGTGGGGSGSGGDADDGIAGCGGAGGDPGDFYDGGGGGGGGYWGGGGGGGGGSVGAAVVAPAAVAVSGGGGGGAGSNFHDPTTTSNFSAVTDAPIGGSATISYAVTTPTPTSNTAPITVPATGDGGATPSVGLLLLIGGVILLIPVLAGWRRQAP